MKAIKPISLIFAVLCPLAMAKVSGERTEVLGTQWPQKTLESWAHEPGALLTPEVSHLVTQACFRQSQERLDVLAFATSERLVKSMNAHFAAAPARDDSRHDAGLRSLSGLLNAILALPTPGRTPARADYEDGCNRAVSAHLSREGSTLEAIFDGRLHPKPLPALQRAGIEVAPLTWAALTEQICKLEGYYSTSSDARLWKFFSITRTLGNVLPADRDNDAFLASVAKLPPEVILDIQTLNRYSSVAGKVNGATVGMSAAEIAKAPTRMTGVAMGSRAASMMAFFTTGWREELQQDIVRQTSYPNVPFELISLSQTLDAIRKTVSDPSRKTRDSSATEIGMDSAWHSLAPCHPDTGCVPAHAYGPVTKDYVKTAALAWLALNAETNIRQNEKLGGIKATSAPEAPRTRVFGDPAQYDRMERELAAAVGAYKAIDPSGTATPYCVKELQAFATEAKRIPDNKIGAVDESHLRLLNTIAIDPVVADIGMEVDDADDGIFRLHLGMGYGHEVPAEVDGQNVTLWTPSAMVLHLPHVLTTAEWQSREVGHYDPR